MGLSSRSVVKSFYFENPRWRTSDALERPALQYHTPHTPLKPVTHGQCDLTPDLRLPSQPQGITAPRPVLDYTASWRKHVCVRVRVCVCVNNLHWVVIYKLSAVANWPARQNRAIDRA